MVEQLLQPEIKELLQARDLETLGDVLSDWQPADLAALIEGLDVEEQVLMFQALPTELDASTFEYLDLDIQQSLLNHLPASEVASVLNGMAADDRTALFEELPPQDVTRFLAHLSREELVITQNLLGYPEDSVGRVMTPDYIAVHQDWTVKHVLDFVRNNGKDSETLNMIYVVDSQNKLIDDIRIREFLLAPLHETVGDLMDHNFISLGVNDDKSGAVELFRKYDRVALPVIDAKDTLVGIVTVDDVMDIAEEEATREIQNFGGLEALDEPYIATPLWELIRKRAVWLIILFVGEMLTATAMGYFEGEIQKAVVLTLFLPLIISSGGNSGSQAATLIIRALALGEVRLRDWWMVMRRELFSGALLGVILGTIGFLRIAIWSQFSEIYGEYWLLIAITVSISLIGIVTWGTLAGAMLPFILKKLGADPAKSSAPFVATLVDVTGLVIYFTVAMVILHNTVLKADVVQPAKHSGVSNVVSSRPSSQLSVAGIPDWLR